MKNQIVLGTIICSAMMIAGCGSNSKPDGNVITNGEASMSIELEGRVKFDNTRGCQKLFVMHAIDGNGNPIPNLRVDASVIVETKVVGNRSGTIEPTSPISLTDPSKNFTTSKIGTSDKLIILPSADRHHPSYLGDWDIYGADGNKLKLKDIAYNLETTDQLSYAIGDGSVYIPGYGLSVAHIEQQDSNGTARVTSEKGYANFDLIYDLSLIGHQAVVGVHSGDGYRIGAGVVVVLPNCISTPDTNSTDSNSTDNNSSR